MCIYVPRAPRPAEAPEVMERLHGVQALFKGAGAGGRQHLRKRGRIRGSLAESNAGASRGDGVFREARARAKKRAGARSECKGAALRRKLAPACLVCVDITILVAVLCALYAPESLPAQFLSSFAAGR